MEERTLELYNELIKIMTPDTVFACIGAVKTTSYLDSIGPQVGDILKANGLPYVYGTHKKPYDGLSAERFTKMINKRYKNNTVIAIDLCCCLDTEKLYKIQLDQGFLTPGAGVNKKLSKIGDYAIRVYMLTRYNKDLVVNYKFFKDKDYEFLKNKTDESIKIISDAIIQAYKYVCTNPSFNITELKTNKISKLV